MGSFYFICTLQNFCHLNSFFFFVICNKDAPDCCTEAQGTVLPFVRPDKGKKKHGHMLQIISKVNSSRSSLKKYIASRTAVSIDA